MRDDTKQVRELVDEIGPLFKGKEPRIISAALADLTATLFAGYQGEEKDKLRNDLVREHMALVRRLIPINEKMILKRIKATSN